MSLSRRLIRIAQRSIEDLADGIRGPGTYSDARQELESFLADPIRHQRTPPPPSPPPPPDPLTPHYLTLGVAVGADQATIEKAWRRLVLENHPDRYMHDAAEQRLASERLRRMNDAHEILLRELRLRGRGKA